jgi:hypothetical protein
LVTHKHGARGVDRRAGRVCAIRAVSASVLELLRQFARLHLPSSLLRTAAMKVRADTALTKNRLPACRPWKPRATASSIVICSRAQMWWKGDKTPHRCLFGGQVCSWVSKKGAGRADRSGSSAQMMLSKPSASSVLAYFMHDVCTNERPTAPGVTCTGVAHAQGMALKVQLEPNNQETTKVHTTCFRKDTFMHVRRAQCTTGDYNMM